MSIFLCNALRRLWRECRGATAIEYGLIAAGISMVIVISFFLLGDELDVMYVRFVTALQDVISGV